MFTVFGATGNTGSVVASLDGVTAAVSGTVTGALGKLTSLLSGALRDADLRRVSADDLKHVLARVESFPEDQRLFLGNGYALGVRADLIAAMSPEQQRRFLQGIVTPALEMSRLFMEMVNAKAHAMVEEARPRLAHRNRVFPAVVNRTLVLRALSQITRTFAPAFLAEKMLSPEMASKDLWELLDRQCREEWDSYQRILATDFKPPTRDAATERLRRDIARHALAGHADRASFETVLLDDARANLAVVRELVDGIEAYFPRDLLLISDAKTAFEDKVLFRRLADTLLRIKKPDAG